jgi:hypothetical protein
MLGCILCDGALLATLAEPERDFIAASAYRYALLRAVAQTIHDLHEDHGTADLSTLLRNVEDIAVKEAAIGLASRIDHETDRDKSRLHAHWQACLNRARHDDNRRKPAPSPMSNQDAAGTDFLLEQIKLKRAAHASLGADRRVFPKSG